MEKYIEQRLQQEYSQLDIKFNDVSTINKELDIYIPRLKIAFELNGIFHYKPIFSDKKLLQTQNSDRRKINKCDKLGIKLHIIDISWLRNFKSTKAEHVYQQIKKIIAQ